MLKPGCGSATADSEGLLITDSLSHESPESGNHVKSEACCFWRVFGGNQKPSNCRGCDTQQHDRLRMPGETDKG